MSICWQKVSQNCHKRKKSTVEGEETAGNKFFENIINEESADHRESFKIDCFNNPFLLRKRKSRRYHKFYQNSF